MTSADLFLNGRPVKVARRIGRGGEGDVYQLEDDPGAAIKIYTVTNAQDREAKVAAMIDAGLASKSALASFPEAIVRDPSGRFVGFRMKLIRDHKPLHDLYSPGSRKHNFPHADYRFLVRSAANLARAVAAVHFLGCVIGDINHSGILISDKATVTLIDADSFQFSAKNHVFHCRVGVPEYTPPELQGKSLRSVVRTTNHDNFGLAVIIFQLLFMGRHPFVGTVRKGEIAPLHEAIRDYRFVYADGRDVGMDQPPGTPTLADFSNDIGRYFEEAFGRLTADRRPTASDWVHALDTLEASLVQCSDNKIHYFCRDADECPWCFMERQLGIILFLPTLPSAQVIDGIDPGASAFNIDKIWRQTSTIVIPPRSRIQPKLASVPPPMAHASSAPFWDGLPIQKVVCAIAAIGLLVIAPALWFVAAGLGAYAVFSGRSGKKDDTVQLEQHYRIAAVRWNEELIAWQKRIGVDDFLQLQQDLQSSRDQYIVLDRDKQIEIEGYKRQRRGKQLAAFLENFEIRSATIKGIGPAKQAALASFGVDTAADITMSKVLGVPGIGNSLAKDLIEWRSACEGRFVYSDNFNQADVRDLTNIAAKYEAKARTLRRTLVAGPVNLSAQLRRVQAGIAIEDPILNRAKLELEQLGQQLKRKGIVPAEVPVDWPTLRTVGASTPMTSATGQAQSALGMSSGSSPWSVPTPGTTPTRQTSQRSHSPSCPRCGSSMLRRVARRGRNAGRTFWGCSRFPGCRGTRSI